MSYRYMRLLLFYDLPRETSAERKAAFKFQKKLVENGFIMLQESVYCKLALNATGMDSIKAKTRKMLPKKGSVMMLTITEKQFESIEICCDPFQTDVVNKDNRMVIL